MRALIIAAVALSLAGCGTVSKVATDAGASPATATKISTTALDLGTLGCQYGPIVAAVAGVKVNDATASAVAAACSAILVDGVAHPDAVPVPLPTNAIIPVATVPTPVAAAVSASVEK